MKGFLPILLVMAMLWACGCAAAPAPGASPAPATPPGPPAAQPPVAAEPQAQGETVLFTDSLGREVMVPADIERIAVTGPMAQIVLFALAPDRLAGIANAWDPQAEQFLDSKYFNLPILGQLYGGKGELNLETLLASGAQVIVDVGEAKENAREDLDALQEQSGIPFVHISCYTATTGDTYRKLGELLNMPDEGEALAVYCDMAYEKSLSIVNSVEKADVLYCLGEAGLNVIAKSSYHAELLDLMTNNVAVVDEPSSRGSGNEVDMEQILLWNPDIILFAPDSIYAMVKDDPLWQTLPAIAENRYYEVPFGPYNWMMSPPSVQRYLGMMWIAQLLYPDAAQYDLFQEVTDYFQLFYHCDLTQSQFDALVANSIGKEG